MLENKKGCHLGTRNCEEFLRKKEVQMRFTRVKGTRSQNKQEETTKKVRVTPEKVQVEGKWLERARTTPQH